MQMMFQVSASSMAKESVIGHPRLPEGVSLSIVPGQIEQGVDLAIRPEGRALGEDEAASDAARMVTMTSVTI